MSARDGARAHGGSEAGSTVESASGLPLAASGLSVGYGGEPLIEGIELAVRPGEVVTLIGPNGSGKSTILKSLSKHLEPLGGTVLIGGRDLARISVADLAREMAVLLTDRPRTELLTCQDIVEAGRYPYTGRLGVLADADRIAVREAMELAHVNDLRGRDFMRVSDGQRQRVLLARALCQEPRVLILDEPTSFLDVRYQIDLLRILRRMARERQLAVVMSLHELDLAQKASDYVICVKGSRIFRSGTPEEIFTRETISELYDLDGAGYDPLFGSVELGRPGGEPRTFVIAGGGTGAATFRRLAREGRPFCAGVLHEADVDCVLARDLAAEVVAERPFRPIGDEAYARAVELLARCEELVVCVREFGPGNARNESLVEEAERLGIRVVRG